MPVTKAKKEQIISDLRDKVSKQKSIVLVAISKLKVKELAELKKRLKATESQIKVAKKTLAEIVFKENKMDFDEEKFKDEVAFIFGFKDEVSPAKTAYLFSKEKENLKILGGFMGNKLMTVEEVMTLAQLPTKEQLLGQLVGTIAAPISGFENVLQGNIKGLVRVLTQIKK